VAQVRRDLAARIAGGEHLDHDEAGALSIRVAAAVGGRPWIIGAQRSDLVLELGHTAFELIDAQL
jgi:hypothetical protein